MIPPKFRKEPRKRFLRLSKSSVGKNLFNRARRRVRRARFFRSTSEGKTIPPVRKSPGKSADFQISAVLFLLHENPQIFMVRVKIPFDTQRNRANGSFLLLFYCSCASSRFPIGRNSPPICRAIPSLRTCSASINVAPTAAASVPREESSI